MNSIKKILKYTFFILISIIIVGNTFIRVSDRFDDYSYGIFENIFFGKSFFEYIEVYYKSENLIKWENVSEGSNKIAEILRKNGRSICEDIELDSLRKDVGTYSKKLYLEAENTNLEYLKESNEMLPYVFSSRLKLALKLWSEGLEEKNCDKVYAGIENYNEFLLWIQSKNRDDFKTLK